MLEGLEAGDRVVVRGNFLVDSRTSASRPWLRRSVL
jgi:hypothetical protein